MSADDPTAAFPLDHDAFAELLDSLRLAKGRAALLQRRDFRRSGLVNVQQETEYLVDRLEAAIELVQVIVEPERPSNSNLVLIVDDNQTCAHALRQRLGECGVTAFVEGTADSAAATHEVLRPSIVFVSASLRERNGLTVAAELRQLSAHAKIILLAESINPEIAFDSGACGVDRIVEQGAVEAMVAISRGDLPRERVVFAAGFPDDEEASRQHAQRAVALFGSVAAASRILGIDPRTISKRLGPAKQRGPFS